MSHCGRRCLPLLLLAALAGCGNLGRPDLANLFNAPPTSIQLAQAKQYDPYPDPTIAPVVMGGRPLGFTDPRYDPDVTKIPLRGLPYAAYPPATTIYPPPSTVLPPPTVGYAPPATSYLPPATSAPAAAPLAYGTKIVDP